MGFRLLIISTRCQATTFKPFQARCVQGAPSSLHISPANCLHANQVGYVGCCPTLSSKFLIALLVGNVSIEEWSNQCVFPFVNSRNSCVDCANAILRCLCAPKHPNFFSVNK